MTVTASRRSAAPPPEFEAATCLCGSAVIGVRVADALVVVDKDKDPDGEIRGVKYGGRWVYTEANVDGVNGQQVRYRRHRCTRTMQSDLRRRLDRNDTSGPCRGYCGKQLPRVYGPNPTLMCDDCSEKLAQRRAST